MNTYKALSTGFIGGRRVRTGETFTSRLDDIPWAEPVPAAPTPTKAAVDVEPAPKPRSRKAKAAVRPLA